jgi:ketopantoate reductase
MNVCLIGNGLTNLVLAQVLESKNIRVTILFDSKKTNNFNSRSIAISNKNYDYLNNDVINIKKISWPVNNIEIFKETNIAKKIFNFKNKQNNLFFTIKYNNFYNLIKNKIFKNK